MININPIFNDYITFLKDNNINLKELKEGYYWLDNQIIKAFDTDGNIHKIARIKIDDNLKLSVSFYSNKKNEIPYEIESWDKTSIRLDKRLSQLEEESLNLINNYLSKFGNYIPTILTSGGKDSSVTMFLVRKIINANAIFTNTSLDCADTYKHIKTIDNINIINPKEGFYKWRKRLNFIPTKFARACCSIFKESSTNIVLQKEDKYLFFMGMRNEESNTRANYSDEWNNEKWGNRDWKGILPIRKWTELDVWLYILKYNIDINSKYKKGYSRVGCAIACPYYTKTTWALDKYWYPKMYERWQNILKNDFIDNFKWTILNCTLKEYYSKWNGGIVRENPTEEVIKEFADCKGIEYEVAKKYFNKTCKTCDKKVSKKDVLAMNMKLLGRNTNVYYCKKHLMEFLEINTEQWNKYIQEFKQSGCDLF